MDAREGCGVLLIYGAKIKRIEKMDLGLAATGGESDLGCRHSEPTLNDPN